MPGPGTRGHPQLSCLEEAALKEEREGEGAASSDAGSAGPADSEGGHAAIIRNLFSSPTPNIMKCFSIRNAALAEFRSRCDSQSR